MGTLAFLSFALPENLVPVPDALGLTGKKIIDGIKDIDPRDLVALSDGIHDVLTVGHMTEDGVLVVEVGLRSMRDKKLATVGVWPCVGHRENTGAIVLQVGSKLILKPVAGTACPCPGGIAALDHEIGNDTVEGDAVIVPTLRQIEEIGHCHGHVATIERGLDISLVSFQDDVDIRHDGSIDRSECRATQPRVRQMITRFAPSPTGHLHLGHAYAAWVAQQAARDQGGQFLLRWEDIDPSRCRAEYEEAILDDLEWLGLAPDASPTRQSDRYPIYQEALEALRPRGLLYPCFCTRRDIQHEIESAGQAPHGPEGPLYPGTCRRLSKEEASERIRDGEAHAWRLKMEVAIDQCGDLTWHDTLAGDQSAKPGVFGDVVLARKETPTSYHLAVTLDDAEQRITLVTRGRDLFEATSVHRLLQALFNLPVPEWQHHRLICDANGKRLATRDHATSLRHLREQGATPADIFERILTAEEKERHCL